MEGAFGLPYVQEESHGGAEYVSILRGKTKRHIDTLPGACGMGDVGVRERQINPRERITRIAADEYPRSMNAISC
jgi:hypothetical protein